MTMGFVAASHSGKVCSETTLELSRSPHLIRFGVFELDLRARELRKSGVSTGLPEQSIKILALLLEKPGKVVLREEIRKKLWPNDTVVEFDHSINAAIKRLRQALGDSADIPSTSRLSRDAVTAGWCRCSKRKQAPSNCQPRRLPSVKYPQIRSI